MECADSKGNPVSVSLCQMDPKPEETVICSAKKSCAKDLFKGFSSLGLQKKKKYVWRFGGWTAVSILYLAYITQDKLYHVCCVHIGASLNRLKLKLSV